MPAILALAAQLASSFFSSKEKAEEVKTKILAMGHDEIMARLDNETKVLLGQLDINKVEAGSESLFIAGWRPLVGWICAIAFGFSYLLLPLIQVVLHLFGHGAMPVLDTGDLMGVLGGMLGMGAIRSYDKGIKKKYDRKQVFVELRAKMRHLSQEQVDAVNEVLQYLEKD